MTGIATDQWVSLPQRPLARRALAIARRIDRLVARVTASHARIAEPRLVGGSATRRRAAVLRRRTGPSGPVIAPLLDVQPIVPVYEDAPAPRVPVDAGLASEVEVQPVAVARREVEQPRPEPPGSDSPRSESPRSESARPGPIRSDSARSGLARSESPRSGLARSESARPESPKLLRSEPEPPPMDLPADMRFLWDVWQREKPGGRGVLERSRGARIVEGPALEPDGAPASEEMVGAPVQVAREALPTDPEPLAPERVEQARGETKHVEPERVEQARVEPARVEPARVEQAHVETEGVEPARVEQARVEMERVEPERLEPERVEPERVEPARVELQPDAPEPLESVSNPPRPSTGPMRISRTPKTPARTVEGWSEPPPRTAHELPRDSPRPEPELRREPRRPEPEPRPGSPGPDPEPRLGSVPSGPQPAVARLEPAPAPRPVTSPAPVRVSRREAPVRVHRHPRPAAVADPPWVADEAPPARDDALPSPDDPPGPAEVARVAEPAVGLLRRAVSRAFARPRADDLTAAPDRSSSDEGAPGGGVRSGVIDGLSLPDPPRASPVRLRRRRIGAAADTLQRQWVPRPVEPTPSAPPAPAVAMRRRPNRLDRVSTPFAAALSHGADLVDAVSGAAEAAIADLPDHALSSIASPGDRPSALPPGGRRGPRASVHGQSARGRVQHAHGSRHGDGGGAGPDQDHMYRELLQRLREDREQLGLVVDEPF